MVMVNIQMECNKIKVLVKIMEIITETNKHNNQPRFKRLKVIKYMLETLIQVCQI